MARRRITFQLEVRFDIEAKEVIDEDESVRIREEFLKRLGDDPAIDIKMCDMWTD